MPKFGSNAQANFTSIGTKAKESSSTHGLESWMGDDEACCDDVNCFECDLGMHCDVESICTP